MAGLVQTFARISQTLCHGSRWAPWRWLVWLSLLLSTLTRSALLLQTRRTADPSIGEIFAILSLGSVYDVLTASFLFLPIVVTLGLLPPGWRRYRVWRVLLLASTAS